MHKLKWSSALVAAVGLATASSVGANQLFFDFNTNLNSPNASVFLFGASGQTANVSNLDGFNSNVVLGVDGFFNLPIPSVHQQSGTGVRTSGFKIDSPNPIAAYFINRASATTDMTFVLDSAALGTNYVVASQGTSIGEGSQVAIHAISDATTITFTPKGGAPIVQVLNAGETYKYAGGSVNLTGSTVSSNKAVAVFGGHNCAQVPNGASFCDTLLEQMIPNNNLSSNYFLTASAGANLASNQSDLVRVVASQAGTVVTRDGVIVATLVNVGDFHEFLLAKDTGTRIQTSAPALVAQYLTGGGGQNTDPAMSLVPGADTYLESYRLATPSGAQQFDVNYASLVIETNDLSSLKLDGVAVNTASFSGIGSTGFSRGIVNLPLGLFDLVADDPFLVMLGGGSNADSYFTYGGSTFAPGISPPPDVEPPPPGGIPEPGSMALLGLALGALALTRRRANDNKATRTLS